MKKIYKVLFLGALFLGSLSIQAQNAWINELHYDNAGSDEGEFLEIVIENPGSYSLSDFEVYLYNGNNGESYDNESVDNFTVGATVGSFTIYYWYPASIQNGAPDGLSLSYQGTVIEGQFLSYEGSFPAANGPANGITSTDIGVMEDGSTQIGESLQLTGSGSSYSDFSWLPPASETPGMENNGQSFGGAVNPEPSNYPTDFSATTIGLSIGLSWTESVGDQLPVGYLILGEKLVTKSFNVPVDGIPVENDLDWSDGEVSVNVVYGIGEYLFEGLEPGTTYSFTIYPYTNAGSNIDYKTDGEPPVTSAVTDNIIIVNEENFDNGLGTWTPYSVIGDQEWEQSEYGGQTFAKITGYDGAPYENEDWLISPEMDWTNFDELYFSFSSAMNYTGPDLQLFLSQDYDGSGNPNDFTWLEITSEYTWSGGSWEWVASGAGDLTLYEYPTAYLAFKFTSTTDGSATWELDDLMVYGTILEGIEHNVVETINVYPNPASNKINIKSSEARVVMIMDITGKLLMETKITAGTNSINIETLHSGLYIVETFGNSGIRSTGKFTVK